MNRLSLLKNILSYLKFRLQFLKNTDIFWVFFAGCRKPFRCVYPTWSVFILFRIASLFRSLTVHLQSNHVSGILLQCIASLCFYPGQSNHKGKGLYLCGFRKLLCSSLLRSFEDKNCLSRVITAIFTKEILWDVVGARLLFIFFSPGESTKPWPCPEKVMEISASAQHKNHHSQNSDLFLSH